MDIGDPSEIPARRKPLPSMQELGAFDLGTEGNGPPAAGRAQAGRPLAVKPAPGVGDAAAAPASNDAAPVDSTTAAREPVRPGHAAAALPLLTPEQLRQALAKADPGTRQKLLSLIAGGRTIQQLGAGSVGGGARPRGLVMQLERPPQRKPAPATHAVGAAPTPPAGPSRPGPAAQRSDAVPRNQPASPPAGSGVPAQTLLQIDENTELLDATGALPSPAQRKSELQARLDAVLHPQAGPRGEPPAHKVIFPAYDPTRHGEDVHSTARRRPEAPVEGHFPAPRQPLRTSYQHPDGKPMTPEESKVEEVLQAQRCEETLSVLARDGVNGLLLSPRDLDAAVQQGLLNAETAATLWKTWAALRPVIHVIEDDPPEPAADPASATSAEPTESNEPSEASGGPDGQASAADLRALGPVPTAHAPLRSPVEPDAATPAPALPKPSPPPPLCADPPLVRPAPAVEPEDADTLPLGTRVASPAGASGAAAVQRDGPARRLRWLLHWLLRGFVAYAVISTVLRLGAAGWYSGWGWDLLRWVGPWRGG